MNKFIKFSVIAFIAGSLILFFGKGNWFPDFYNPKFMGVIGLLCACLIILPRLVFKSAISEIKEKALTFLQNILAIILLLNAAGALGLFQLYKIGFEYDKFLHFIVPSLIVIALTYFNYHWYDIQKFGKSLILSTILVIVGGFAWELFEFLGDSILKTQMLGYYGKFISEDTFWDLIMNGLGSIAGIFISIVKVKKFH